MTCRMPERLFSNGICAALALLLATSLFPVLAQAKHAAEAEHAAQAEHATMTGTRVMNDRFGSERVWGRALELDRPAEIIRVMYGTYGFSIWDEEGEIVADFWLPEQAVGYTLDPGRYEIKPYVCRQHRHHHVEVTVAY